MGYFQVRYDSRVVNYDRRGFIRLTTGQHFGPWQFSKWDFMRCQLVKFCWCGSDNIATRDIRWKTIHQATLWRHLVTLWHSVCRYHILDILWWCVFWKNGPFSASFSLFSSFQCSWKSTNVQFKFCQWLDSNRGPLVLEVTTLPTEPQPLPKLGWL